MNDQIETKDYLEDEEINEIVSKILPHLQGLSYSQSERVLYIATKQAARLSVLDATSIRKACEELQRASSGQV